MLHHSRNSTLFLSSLLLIVGATAQAQNLLTNGSFEQGAFVSDGQNVMSLNPGSTVITGWTTTNAELAWVKHPNPFPGISASDGVFSLDLTGDHDSSPYGGVQQTLATVPNGSYNLSFDLGGLSGSNANYSITASAGNASQTFTYNPFLGGSNYGSFNMDFTATGDSAVISLIGAASGSGNYIALDNVSVTSVASATPAPSALLTALLGVVPGVMLLRRRRK